MRKITLLLINTFVKQITPLGLTALAKNIASNYRLLKKNSLYTTAFTSSKNLEECLKLRKVIPL